MRVGDLVAGSKNWATVTLAGLSGRGHLNPRLSLALNFATPNERIETELRDVRLQVLCADEILGETRLTGEHVAAHGHSCTAEVPVTRRSLEFVTSRLAHHAAVDLELTWYGLLRVRWQPGEGVQRMMGDPEPGVWTDVHLPANQPGSHAAIARSDWFERVLQPTGGDGYVYLEVAVPRGDAADGWRRSLGHLDSADKAYALGDDAAVFHHLRGALDALPGAKKNIVDRLPEPQRSAVDDLIRAIGTYLHLGRHVAAGGETPGAFPVDRQSAGFAVALIRVTISYLSHALTDHHSLRSSP